MGRSTWRGCSSITQVCPILHFPTSRPGCFKGTVPDEMPQGARPPPRQIGAGKECSRDADPCDAAAHSTATATMIATTTSSALGAGGKEQGEPARTARKLKSEGSSISYRDSAKMAIGGDGRHRANTGVATPFVEQGDQRQIQGAEHEQVEEKNVPVVLPQGLDQRPQATRAWAGLISGRTSVPLRDASPAMSPAGRAAYFREEENRAATPAGPGGVRRRQLVASVPRSIGGDTLGCYPRQQSTRQRRRHLGGGLVHRPGSLYPAAESRSSPLCMATSSPSVRDSLRASSERSGSCGSDCRGADSRCTGSTSSRWSCILSSAFRGDSPRLSILRNSANHSRHHGRRHPGNRAYARHAKSGRTA